MTSRLRKTHPLTGAPLVPVEFTTRRGEVRLIWPILGGSQPAGEPAGGGPPAAPPDGTPPATPPGGDGFPANTAPADMTPEQQASYWRDRSRQNESQAKANAAAAKELDAIKEAQKTAEQKAADRLAATERRAAEAETRALRAEVVLDKKLPANLAKFVSGSTREEMESAADELLAAIPAANTGPRPDPSQGPRGGQGPLTGAEAGRAEAARRFNKGKT